MPFIFKPMLINSGGEPIFVGNETHGEFLARQFPNVDPVAEGWMMVTEDKIHVLNPTILPPIDLHDAMLMAINSSNMINYTLPVPIQIDFPDGNVFGQLSAMEVRRLVKYGWEGYRQALEANPMFESKRTKVTRLGLGSKALKELKLEALSASDMEDLQKMSLADLKKIVNHPLMKPDEIAAVKKEIAKKMKKTEATEQFQRIIRGESVKAVLKGD